MPHLIYLESVTGYEPREDARRLDLLRSLAGPGVTIEMRKAPGGPAILERQEDFDQAHRAGLAAVRAIAPAECGALIAAGAVDPGLGELRRAARVPVIGPGEASLYLASLLGARLVILTVEPAVAAAHAMIEVVRTRPPVVVVRSLRTTVRKILADPDEGRRLLRHEAAAAVREERADVLYLGSMTQGSLGIASDLRAELGVPVLDPLPVSLHAAEQAAGARTG